MSIVFSMIARENLPNDTVELKGLVYQLLDVVEQQKLLIANQNERIEALFLKNEEQAHQIDQLTDQVNALKRHQFGKRSEKNQKEKGEEKEKQSEKTSSQDGYFRADDGPTGQKHPFELLIKRLRSGCKI